MKKKYVGIAALAACLMLAPACTNMTKTQQAALSGTALGAGAGLGIGALTGGSGTMGAIIGGVAGGVLGSIYGSTK